MPTPAIDAGAEFQALPIEYLVGAPLTAAVKAQAMAAGATLGFVKSLIDKDGNALTASFKMAQTGAVAKGVDLSVPLMSLVPVPHLRIDAVDTEFKYTISQTINSKQSFEWSVDAEAKAGFNALVVHGDFSVKGHMMSQAQEDSSVNRCGALTVKVHASESPMPEGLARVLSILANAVAAQDGKAATT